MHGTGKINQSLRALTDFLDDLGSILITHVATPISRDLTSYSLQPTIPTPSTYKDHRHTCEQNTPIHKISKIALKYSFFDSVLTKPT